MVKSPYLIFITQLNRFVSQKYWKAKLIALLFIYSLFFATPPLHYLTTAFKGENWQAFNFKTENLTGQPPYGPASHAAKKTFRIFVPIIAKIFHLNNWAVFTLQYIVGLILLLLVINLALLITESNLIASLVTIGFCSIYAGRAAFTDINTWFDEFAFLLLVVPLCFRKPD
jgi:4-amino-4-deoxy-L-arabinose transferase-like glycosyltransferase